MYAPHSSTPPIASSVPVPPAPVTSSGNPVKSSEARRPPRLSRRPFRPAFTLTELLIVIAIIAVLAGLIAAAAVNAMRAANRGRISLEIKQISGSLEEFKNEYGSYPPNGMNKGPNPSNSPTAAGAMVRADFVRIFNQAFPNHQEPKELIDAIAGITPASTNFVTTGPLPDGLRAAEALYFWLGGFSQDSQFPITGDNGPSFTDARGNNDGSLTPDDEVLENRNRRYEFELARLGPRDGDNYFAGRFLQYKDPRNPNVLRQINFWTYAPNGSEQPFVYFDTSRYKPGRPQDGRYDFWASDPEEGDGTWIVAFKQLREGVTNPSTIQDIVFVNQNKFQVLHSGIDGVWGSDAFQGMHVPSNLSNLGNVIRFPDGPFIGEIADTLTNFTDGAVEDAADQ